MDKQAQEQPKYRIYLKGKDETDDVLDYERTGNRYEVTFNNFNTYTYNASNVRIVENALNNQKSRNCLNYLKRIAEEIGLKVKIEQEEINILSHNYSKIDFVLPDSMLGAFLSGALLKNEQNETPTISEPIYPFGFNISQKDAVDKALKNQLSIIEGPPGTGKTQTILNIIANAVMRGESVAVVSSNNSATKNVLDKLQKYNVDFIAAYLGNTDNKNDFINSQKPLPDMTDWKLDPEAIVKLQQELKLRYETLCEKLVQKNKLAALKQELSSVEVEQKHFLQYSATLNIDKEPQEIHEIKVSKQALEMWLLSETCKNPSQNKGIVAFIKSIFEQFWLWLFDNRKWEVYKLLKQYTRECLVTAFQQKFYELKINELKLIILALKHPLEQFNFDTKMHEYSEISARLFRSKLAEKYVEQKRKTYELDDLWKDSEDFIKDYPVILSTTYSLRSSLSSRMTYGSITG